MVSDLVAVAIVGDGQDLRHDHDGQRAIARSLGGEHREVVGIGGGGGAHAGVAERRTIAVGRLCPFVHPWNPWNPCNPWMSSA
jgi:hypothetical protein